LERDFVETGIFGARVLEGFADLVVAYLEHASDFPLVEGDLLDFEGFVVGDGLPVGADGVAKLLVGLDGLGWENGGLDGVEAVLEVGGAAAEFAFGSFCRANRS
jgi:hypothetical protein